MAMDPAAFAHQRFGRLPGFDPLMFVNLSGLCATTKLLQSRKLGIYQVDVSRKFQRGPEAAPDLHEEDFLARKRVIDQVAAWVNKTHGTKRGVSDDEWTPILYHFEIGRSASKRSRDCGHVVFTDSTTTRFLLVMCFGPPQCNCGNPFHHDYDNLTKYQADRFMSLLTYLFYDEAKPSWVRATYTTLQMKDLPTAFMDPSVVPSSAGNPPIFHVTAQNFVPSLIPSELERVDNIIAQSSSCERAPEDVRLKVTGTKEDRPKVVAWLGGQEKNQIQCAYCDKVGDHTMSTCSRCKLVRYCDKKCQWNAWKSHKPVCKVASGSVADA